jgi:uncharacterized protein with HEPN domain
MNERAKKLLFDVVTACDEVNTFTVGKTREDYLTDALLRRGVERMIEIMGEALAQLRNENRAVFDLIADGGQIVSMRNRLIHGYDTINPNIVWDTAVTDVPALRETVSAMLKP